MAVDGFMRRTQARGKNNFGASLVATLAQSVGIRLTTELILPAFLTIRICTRSAGVVPSDIQRIVSDNTLSTASLRDAIEKSCPHSRWPCHDGGDHLQWTMNLMALPVKQKGSQQNLLEPLKLTVPAPDILTELLTR